MSQPSSKVKLSDVAKACGMGLSTVSHALRNNGNVSRKTALHVQQVAREMGYAPDPLMAALGTLRGKLDRPQNGVPLAVVASSGLPNIQCKYLLKTAAKMGYTLSYYNLSDHGGNWSRLLTKLYNKGVLGIILTEIKEPVNWQAHDWSHFCVVVDMRQARDAPFHTVRSGVFDGVVLAWEKLRELGCKRIGTAVCSHPNPIRDDDSRRAAVCLLQDQIQKLVGEHVVTPFYGIVEDEDGFLAWFKREKPDGVIAFGIHHYFHLKKVGVRMPEDCRFACLHLHGRPDDPDFKGVAGIDQNLPEIGRAVIEQMDQLIRHHSYGIPELVREVVIPCSWRDGGSAGLPLYGARSKALHK